MGAILIEDTNRKLLYDLDNAIEDKDTNEDLRNLLEQAKERIDSLEEALEDIKHTIRRAIDTLEEV